jgi:hypothetical protein
MRENLSKLSGVLKIRVEEVFRRLHEENDAQGEKGNYCCHSLLSKLAGDADKYSLK